MKTIGILTFHAAHNYGSMLQNYALQQELIKMGYAPETINLRTTVQKEIYNFFEDFCQMQDKKHIARKIVFYPWKESLVKKYQLFEEFLAKELRLSAEINCYEDIKTLHSYDAYIVGSDQCWNVDADDFDWSYFLDFVPTDSLRLSYAISMGPNPKKSFVEQACIEGKVANALRKFDGISVRDEDTMSIVKQITNSEVSVDIHVDPTMLLTKDEWERKIQKDPIVKGEYIFFYNPYWIANVFEQASKLGKLMGMKVVVSLPNIIGLFKYPQFKNVFAVGPWEFLNLVKNATYVIGRSFHLVVFSMIFQKKFIAVDAMGDSRIRQLLTDTCMEDCASKDVISQEVIDRLDKLDYSKSLDWLNNERTRSFKWLEEHIN